MCSTGEPETRWEHPMQSQTHNPLLYYSVVSRIFHSFDCEKRAAEWGQRAFMVLAFEWKLAGMNFLPAKHGSMNTAAEMAQIVIRLPP